MSRRDRLTICMLILESIHELADGQGVVRAYRLRERLNLAYPRLKDYLRLLERSGLIEAREGLKLTERGVRYLPELARALKVLKLQPLGRTG